MNRHTTLIHDTLNVGGRLLSLARPLVMGIVNVTPDSFFAGSRCEERTTLADRVRQMTADGADIIDVGACSTRPGSVPVPEEEERERLRKALTVVRQELPDAVVSVDTFRPAVARMAVEEFGADIINDVEGTDEMFQTVAQLRVPYIYMSSEPTVERVLADFARAVSSLRELGQKDIILDPGFGFGKTLDENFALLAEMDKLCVMQLPLLVGLSRKRMVWQTLGITPDEALNGTTVLNTLALTKGASILRVHDVREAAEAIALTTGL